MKKIILSIAVVGIFSITTSALALSSVPPTEYPKNFRSVAEIKIPSIKVPSLIEASFREGIGNYNYALVYDKTEGIFVPSLLFNNDSTKLNPVKISTSPPIGGANQFEFDLPSEGIGEKSITYNYGTSIRSNSLDILLDEYVALPLSIEIKAMVDGKEKIVLAKIVPNGGSLKFPETTSNTWTVTFEFGQPLRIRELSLNNLNIVRSASSVKFIAKPDHLYVVYLDPQAGLNYSLGEYGDLYSNVGVIKGVVGEKLSNAAFKEADSDVDGIIDINDNCVRISNPEQEDIDNNGRGDTCDDYDRDGVINSIDNCPNDPNQSQIDTDNDGKGDTCDGEESRITEKYPGLVWGGIIFAGLVFIGLFASVISKARKSKSTELQN